MRITILSLVASICMGTLSFAQSKSISGVVADEGAEGLPGVTVQIKGTTVGTITDFDGNYSIEASAEDVLVFSFIGYLPQEIPVGKSTRINVSMELDVKQLEEVVVVGYGTMKKSDLTGAVTSMDSEDLAKVRSANVVEVMQGKAAGVDISRSSGRAGSGYDIKIRGTRSITATNDPLYVVDGVPYGSNVTIDPNDIESVEILKDASSTAIYGSRGANGVVMITTKKGSKGKGKVSFNAYYGVTEAIGDLPLADRDYFIQLLNDLQWAKDRITDPTAPPTTDGYLQNLRAAEDANADVNWYDEVLRKGVQQNYNLSLSGASDKLSYSTSISYYNEAGLLKGDEYDRYTLRLNLEGKINDYVSVGTSSISSMVINGRRGSPLGDARKLSPLAKPYDSAGNIIAFPRFPEEVQNPLITADPDYYLRETRRGRLFNTFYVNVGLFDNALNYRSSINMDLDFQRDGEFEGVLPRY